ncbi:winged helix-turn-helix domain-containing protein [Haloarcula sp. S1AR25-5A]|uniref:Winged helix-turn-helix domain-containing protein n=1 Tax=Haloarcula terrestris TaxID=2950533 RepID=A0AAE4EZL1_9EURY|nr:winged helix-turn-helix domain-containing protein [Haloarcula terrestris]MDS0222294.1 winged helix-turn-helix domain-containing protein [Haloarcula terrestris]
MTADNGPVSSATTSDSHDGTYETDSGPTDELLALFGDDYTCKLLRTLRDGAMPARALAEATGMSRPTVYRRLDRLTDAGLVEERLQVASDGHHRKEFRLTVDSVAFEVTPDGIDDTVVAGQIVDD